jgi:hypothetical protein
MAGIWCGYILFPLVCYVWACLGMYVWLYVYLYFPTHCGRLGCYGGILGGWGRCKFFGRDSKNLSSVLITSPADFSRSIFSQLDVSNFQVRCITSPRSVILIGYLLVWKYTSVLFALAIGDRCTNAR